LAMPRPTETTTSAPVTPTLARAALPQPTEKPQTGAVC